MLPHPHKDGAYCNVAGISMQGADFVVLCGRDCSRIRRTPERNLLSADLHKTEGGHAVAPEIEHFRTDHLLSNIGHRAISGGFVTFGAQTAKFTMNLAAAAILARLLDPKDFGLVGMVLGVTAIVNVFKDLGLSRATVQREEITQQQVSNLFWINIAFGVLLTGVCAALAPSLAWFYRDARVESIMLALSLVFVLAGTTAQHQALLTRQMRFQALAVIDVTSMATGFIGGCMLAWFGFGYWALVAQQLLIAVSNLLITWKISSWRPNLPSSNSGVRPMVTFGTHLSLADLIIQFAGSCDSILIGRFFGAAPLGLYSRGQVLLARPIQQVITPTNSVMIPVLSRLNSDPERYRRSYMQAYGGLALIVFSFSAMCFALARPLVLVILGPKWTDVIPLFAAFAMVALSWPLGEICAWMYESQGRGRDQLLNHSASGLVTIAAYLIGLHWGPLGMIVSSAAIGLFVRLPIVYSIAGRKGPVKTRDLWVGFVSHLPCWGAVYVVTALTYRTVIHVHPIMQLLICAPVGLLAGAALMLLFPKPRESAFFAGGKIKNALLAKFASA